MYKILIRFIKGGKRCIIINDNKVFNNYSDYIDDLLIKLYPDIFDDENMYDIYFRKYNNNVLMTNETYIFDKDLYRNKHLNFLDFIGITDNNIELDLLIIISRSSKKFKIPVKKIYGCTHRNEIFNAYYLFVLNKMEIHTKNLFTDKFHIKKSFDIYSNTGEKGHIICDLFELQNNCKYIYIDKLIMPKCKINFNNNTCKICDVIKYELNVMSNYENRCFHIIRNIYDEIRKYYNILYIETINNINIIPHVYTFMLVDQ
jgi:hypothetical protein